MRKAIGVAMAVAMMVPVVVRADDDAVATKAPLTDAEFCLRSRKPRVESTQIAATRWLARVQELRAACTAAWVKTGAVRVDGNRISPETKGDVQCPKGVPKGDTKESVWTVLALFLEPQGAEDIPLSVDAFFPSTSTDKYNDRCVAEDAKVGLNLRPPVSALPAVRRIIAWKP